MVNASDMAIVANNLGTTGTPGWVRSDVNGDGKVDILDMILVGQNFG